MSSPYQILDNRPLDQWKVTELKEELKRRKLTIRGLKEDLVKRLDEAVRIERANAQKEADNGLETTSPPDVEKSPTQETVISEDFRGVADNVGKKLEKVDNLPVPADTNSDVALSDQGNIQEGYVLVGEKDHTLVEEETPVHETVVDASVTVTESVISEVPVGEQDSPKAEVQEESGNSNPQPVIEHSEPQVERESDDSKTQLETDNTKSQLENEYSKPTADEVPLDISAPENQVSEVSHNLGSPVKYDSISTDSVSINEKIEIKDNIITDNVKLDLDNIKPKMVAPSSSTIVPVGGDSHPHAMDVEEPHESNTSINEKDDINDTNADLSKKFDSVDVGYSEKLNLDRSSGDDSMEEDVLESKQVESKYRSDDLGDGGEKIEVSDVKEEGHVDIMGDDISAEKKDGDGKDRPFSAAEKRKLNDQPLVGNNEPAKRRRWNTESLKVPEPQSSNLTPTTTPKDTLQSPANKRFSRVDSSIDEDALKERVVPPSPKPPTNALRIDRFLRPFTLKAVQELLGKTGKVTSFWMDHIKTHCYVTYSSVEEALETRNAVYNLQWPPNGGRQLLAEFVDPQEVKTRLETPQAPAVSASAVPAASPTPPGPQPQQSPRQPRQQPQQQKVPAALPPPPPLSNPPQARERPTLPPPPPLPEKLDPPIVTLDDLFRKTKATPRIYYLPLSEEQVAMKLAAQGRSTKH